MANLKDCRFRCFVYSHDFTLCRPMCGIRPWVLHPTEERGCPDSDGLGGVFYVALRE